MRIAVLRGMIGVGVDHILTPTLVAGGNLGKSVDITEVIGKSTIHPNITRVPVGDMTAALVTLEENVETA